MDQLQQLTDYVVQWLRLHLYTISLAWVASILMIYGNALFKVIGDLIKQWHFLLRVLVFVLFCTFGYGWLTFRIADFLESLLASQSDLLLLVISLLGFIAIGLLAEKKHHI